MKFHKGRPPHVGWWLCSSDWWRWWDGENWSFGAKAGCTEITLIAASGKVATYQDQYWCDFWPENALVPRLSINPAAPAKKANKRVTRYVLMNPNYCLPTPVATFKDKRLAYIRKKSIKGGYVLKIRFRSPE